MNKLNVIFSREGIQSASFAVHLPAMYFIFQLWPYRTQLIKWAFNGIRPTVSGWVESQFYYKVTSHNTYRLKQVNQWALLDNYHGRRSDICCKKKCFHRCHCLVKASSKSTQSHNHVDLKDRTKRLTKKTLRNDLWTLKSTIKSVWGKKIEKKYLLTIEKQMSNTVIYSHYRLIPLCDFSAEY